MVEFLYLFEQEASKRRFKQKTSSRRKRDSQSARGAERLRVEREKNTRAFRPFQKSHDFALVLRDIDPRD